MDRSDVQPLTWDVVNLGEYEPRECIPQQSLVSISHDVVNLKGNSTFSSCSYWNRLLKLSRGSTKEHGTENLTLSHRLVNIPFFKTDKLGLVGKCTDHSFRIYTGCYFQFCITKKLRRVNKNLSKVNFFHISLLRPLAKGLRYRCMRSCDRSRLLTFRQLEILSVAYDQVENRW